MTQRKRGWVTLEEALASLEQNPAYVAGRARIDELSRRASEELQRQMQPIIEALRAAGIPVVNSIEELFDTKARENKILYPEALSILLAYFQTPISEHARQVIASALGVKEARRLGWEKLVGLYQDEQSGLVKDLLANVLLAAYEPKRLDSIIELVRDPKNGESRLILLTILMRKSRNPIKVAGVLQELATDPDLVLEIGDYFKRRAKRDHINRDAKPQAAAS